MIKKFSVKINKRRWDIELISTKDFSKLFNKENAAMTAYDISKGYRKIFFCPDHITRSVIAHEVMHAYLADLDNSGVSYGKVEENIVSVLETRLHRVIKVRDTIYSKLRGFRSVSKKD